MDAVRVVLTSRRTDNEGGWINPINPHRELPLLLHPLQIQRMVAV
ncbi:hypothetical protein C5167_013988 [Papaver somniferum]|uniref:Uncharacterized protein n=1 Tax=Papaver somniferum TaxID=3469 RepID=A0A4Y7J1X6_PAPSO|nr:hypothetical protein C5167_013988 [Papaver somniferum]